MSDRTKTVLIVDHDEGMRDHLGAILKRDYRVLRVATGEAALQVMEKEDVELILLDVRLPGIGGFEVLKIARENYPSVEVIITSAVRDLDAAIEAMRYGAYHYISKDFDHEAIRSVVAKASERQDLNRDVVRLRAEVSCKPAATGSIRSGRRLAAAPDRVMPVSLGSGTSVLKRQAGLRLHQVEKLTDSQIFLEVRLLSGRDRPCVVLLKKITNAVRCGVIELNR